MSYLQRLSIKAFGCVAGTIALIEFSDILLIVTSNLTAISQMSTGVNNHAIAMAVAQFISNNLTILSIVMWAIVFHRDIVKCVRYVKGGCK